MRYARLHSVVLRLIALAAILALAAGRANAQVVPFKVNGGGNAPQGLSIFGLPSPHDATGNGTHLGKYSGDDGIAIVKTFDFDTFSGTFKGSFTFEAADGSKLACTYGDTDNNAAEDGVFQVYPGEVPGEVFVVFIAEFNPILAQCTGRFEKLAGGSFLMIAMTEPFPLAIDSDGYTPGFRYSWKGSGSLTFDRKK